MAQKHNAYADNRSQDHSTGHGTLLQLLTVSGVNLLV